MEPHIQVVLMLQLGGQVGRSVRMARDTVSWPVVGDAPHLTLMVVRLPARHRMRLERCARSVRFASDVGGLFDRTMRGVAVNDTKGYEVLGARGPYTVVRRYALRHTDAQAISRFRTGMHRYLQDCLGMDVDRTVGATKDNFVVFPAGARGWYAVSRHLYGMGVMHPHFSLGRTWRGRVEEEGERLRRVRWPKKVRLGKDNEGLVLTISGPGAAATRDWRSYHLPLW